MPATAANARLRAVPNFPSRVNAPGSSGLHAASKRGLSGRDVVPNSLS